MPRKSVKSEMKKKAAPKAVEEAVISQPIEEVETRKPLWIQVQMPDGTTYQVSVKSVSKETQEDKIIADANKKTWFEVQQNAIVVDKVNVDGDIWQSMAKKVIYE